MTELRRWVLMTLCLALAGPALATPEQQHGEGARPWTAQPLLKKARGFSRSLALLRPVGLAVDGATVLPSVAGDEPVSELGVPLREGKLAVRAVDARQGGYYRVAAMERQGAKRRIASTVVYFSNPGPAPRAMLAHPVMPLEIVPVALPREHRHYRAGETWEFVLRHNGRPLADHAVLFESSYGSRRSLRTDADGVVAVSFPDDFPPPAQDATHDGHRGGPRSDFVLSAGAMDVDGRELATAFNYDYRPGAYAGKDIWLGGGFALLGMLAAAPLLRRRDKGRAPR